MTAYSRLSSRVARLTTDPELRSLIYFLVHDNAAGVAIRLDISPDEGRENVASRCLDFLADAEAKLP